MKPFKYQRRRARAQRYRESLQARLERAETDYAWAHRQPDVLLALMLTEERGRRNEARLLAEVFPPDHVFSGRVPDPLRLVD